MIITTAYLTGLTFTARSAEASYPATNLDDLWHLKRRFRAADATKSDTDYLIKINFGAAQALAAVFLNDINFNKIRIRGHASDLGNNWGAATFDSGELTVSLDAWTQRYKIVAELTAFNYQWIAIQVPAAATMVGDYTTKFEIGSILCLTAITALTADPTEYEQETYQPSVDIGRSGKIAISDILEWRGKLTFGPRSTSNEAELIAINAMDYTTPILFYDETGTEAAWIVVKDNNYAGNQFIPDIVRGNTINLREIISG